MNSKPRFTCVLFVASAWLLAPAGAGAEEEGIVPSAPAKETGARAGASVSGGGGSGDSYWGEIPESSSANTVAQEPVGRPAWEYVVDLPVYVASIPIEALNMLAEGGAHAYNSTIVQELVHLFPIKIGPTYLSGGIGLGSQDGFGGNISFDTPNFLNEDGKLKIKLAGSTKGQGKAILGVRHPRGERVMIEAGGGYRSDINSRFYGIGPQDRLTRDRKSFYREEQAWGGLSVERHLGASGFALKFSGIFSGVSANGTEDSDDPRLSDPNATEPGGEGGFADELAAEVSNGRPFVGYRDRSDGMTYTAELSFDNTAEAGRPESGTVLRGKIGYFSASGDDDVQFLIYRGEAQQFVPLWFSRRTLALRGYIEKLEDRGNDPIPFQRLLTNDDPDVFRGYHDYRFRDTGIWAVTAEYRWPLWALNHVNGFGLDAYAFADFGQVFPELDVAGDDITTSYGGGLRIAGMGNFIGRLEVGHSNQETIFRLRADQLFQFGKGGLFHGRNPVPER
jgi:hypothetical protein